MRNFNNRFSRSKMNRKVKNGWKSSDLEKRLTEFDLDEDYDETILSSDKIYDEHEREMEFKKNQSTYKIIERKYFKTQKEPHFLTTSARMQIKYLNKIDPVRWNPEKLSQSFPAPVEDIRKILKKNTHFWGSQRAKNYDKTILENWKNFKEEKGGPIATAIEKIHDMSNPNPNLQETLPALHQSDTGDQNFPKQKIGPFSAIYNSVHLPANLNSTKNAKYGEATENVGIVGIASKQNQKPVTIDMLKDKLLKTSSEESQNDPSMAKLYQWFQTNSQERSNRNSDRAVGSDEVFKKSSKMSSDKVLKKGNNVKD